MQCCAEAHHRRDSIDGREIDGKSTCEERVSYSMAGSAAWGVRYIVMGYIDATE
eukprot:IDg15959t1